MNKSLLCATVAIVLAALVPWAHAILPPPGFTYFDVPGAQSTNPTALSGPNIVGTYFDTSTHGFIYNGSTYTTLNYPGGHDTEAFGIQGNTVVGDYRDSGNFLHGLIYNILTSGYSTFDFPGGVETAITGISGVQLVGGYDHFGAGDGHGWYYNGSTFITVDSVLGPHNALHAIDGNNAVGTYDQNTGSTEQGMEYNVVTSTFTQPLSFPGADRTNPGGISANRMVGTFGDAAFTTAHGFLYDGSTWTEIDDPAHPNATSLTGIEGFRAVGTYFDAQGHTHGLITTVPEPTMPAMLSVATTLLVLRRKRNNYCD